VLEEISACAQSYRVLVSGGVDGEEAATDNLSKASQASALSNALNRFTLVSSKALNSFFFRIF